MLNESRHTSADAPKTPLLSVVVPVFRTERYLDEMMQALLGQTFKDMEVILVDDLSPDGAPAMCDRYAALDPRVRVIHKPVNEGLGMARNTGLDAARGKYIAFHDSDDTLHPDTYAVAVRMMEESGADTVRFTCNRFTDAGASSPVDYTASARIFDRPEEIHSLALGIFDPSSSDFSPYDLGGSSCMAIYRLDILRSHGIRFESEREYISEDYIFSFDYYAYCSKVIYLPRTYYHYRITDGSLTRTLELGVMGRVAHYCRYVVKKIRENGYGSNEESAAAGYYIGALRQHMTFVFLSSELSWRQKREWFMERTSDPYFRSLCASYPLQKLPSKQRILLYAMLRRQFLLSWLLITGFTHLRRDKLKSPIPHTAESKN